MSTIIDGVVIKINEGSGPPITSYVRNALHARSGTSNDSPSIIDGGWEGSACKLVRRPLARALSNKGTVDAFSVTRPPLANSLRSNRGERATAGSDEGTHFRRAYPLHGIVQRCRQSHRSVPLYT